MSIRKPVGVADQVADPKRAREKTNATVMNFWSLGAILAALVTLYLLNNLPPDVGWRAAFGFGAVIALCTGLVRRYIPESPRWLLARGKVEAAEAVIENVEEGHFENPHGRSFGFVRSTASSEKPTSFWRQSHELITRYPGRTALGSLLDFSEAAGLGSAHFPARPSQTRFVSFSSSVFENSGFHFTMNGPLRLTSVQRVITIQSTRWAVL
jgi:MFS family permease